MSDLIEREDAIKDFADYLREADLLKCDGRLYPMEHYLKKAERHMKRIPSARPQGKWILSDLQSQVDNDNGNYAYVCTNCNHTDIHAKTQKVPYCWWCGARMKGADDE